MVREAIGTDQPSVQRLYEMLCPGEPIKVRSDRIEQLRRDPNNHLFVADEEGVIVGTAFLTLCLDPMFGAQPSGVVENVVVDESDRGRGVGSLLVEHIEQLCVARNCSKITLISNAKRNRAHAFFRQLGYDDTVAKGFKKYLGAHRAAHVSE